MNGDTAVIQQEIKNLSAQLQEMQATLIMWMTFQNEMRTEQQKKTPSSPTISAHSPYVLPPLRLGS